MFNPFMRHRNQSINNKNYTAALCFDLIKAFDRVVMKYFLKNWKNMA